MGKHPECPFLYPLFVRKRTIHIRPRQFTCLRAIDMTYGDAFGQAAAACSSARPLAWLVTEGIGELRRRLESFTLMLFTVA